MDANVKKYIKEKINIAKIFKFNQLSNNDKLNIEVICSCKDMINTACFISESSYSLDFVKEACVDTMKIFDEGIADRAFNVMAFIDVIPVFDEGFIFNTDIRYGRFEKNVVDTSNGYVDVIRTPRILDENAFIFLGHELIHAIKDTNYPEFQLLLTLGEVIPNFYEFIIAENIPEISRNYWNCRLEIIKNCIEEYKAISADLSRSLFDKNILRYLLSNKGVYLNSFYYALVLYNLYKIYPDWVMKNVLRVLNHEITTKDLLVILGLYEMNNDNLVSDEIKKLSLYLNR